MWRRLTHKKDPQSRDNHRSDSSSTSSQHSTHSANTQASHSSQSTNHSHSSSSIPSYTKTTSHTVSTSSSSTTTTGANHHHQNHHHHGESSSSNSSSNSLSNFRSSAQNAVRSLSRNSISRRTGEGIWQENRSSSKRSLRFGGGGGNNNNNNNYGSSSSSTSDYQLERTISATALKLGEDIQQIVLMAKMGSSQSTSSSTSTSSPVVGVGVGRRHSIGGGGGKEDASAWKVKLLTMLGGPDPIPTDTSSSSSSTTTTRTMSESETKTIHTKRNKHKSSSSSSSTRGKSNVDILLEHSNHDKFVLRCMENELPPNLIHCLRLLRVMELQAAHANLALQQKAREEEEKRTKKKKQQEEEEKEKKEKLELEQQKNNDDDNNTTAVANNEEKEKDNDELDKKEDEKVNDDTNDDDKNTKEDSTTKSSPPPSSTFTTSTTSTTSTTKPSTPAVILATSKLATSKIEKLLCALCTDATVGEQLRPHLFGLLALSGASYPPNGVHIAHAASKIIIQIARKCLSTSLVWFLHDKRMIVHMTDDAKELCGMTEAQSPASATLCLHGKKAERVGLWVIAMNTIVWLVNYSCNHRCVMLLKDFETAGGYHVLCYVLTHSGSNNLKKAIVTTISMLACRSDVFEDSSDVDDGSVRLDAVSLSGGGASTAGGGGGGGNDRNAIKEDDGRLVKNPIAFEVIEDLLYRSIPFLAQYTEENTSKLSVDSGVGIRELANLSLVTTEKILRDKDRGVAITSDIENPSTFAFEVLVNAMQVFSDHSHNFAIIEKRYNLLSIYILSLPTFSDYDTKSLILKTLVYVCTGLPDTEIACEKPLQAVIEIFFCTCQTLFRLSLDDEKEEESGQDNRHIIETLQGDLFLLCDSLENLLQVNDSLTQMMLHIGVLGEKIEDCLDLLKGLKLDDDKVRNSHIPRPSDATGDTTSQMYPRENIEKVYCAICGVISIFIKNMNISAVSSPRLSTPQSFFDEQVQTRDTSLNMFLTIGIVNLGKEASDAALQLFESKMICSHDETLQVDMGLTFGILNRFSHTFGEYTGVLSSSSSGTTTPNPTKRSLKDVDNRDWSAVLRVQKLLKMLRRVVEANSMAQDAFRKQGGFETLCRLLLCLDGVMPAIGLKDTALKKDMIVLVEATLNLFGATTNNMMGIDKKLQTQSTSLKTLDILSEEDQFDSPALENCAYVRNSNFYTTVVSAVGGMGLLDSHYSACFVTNLALGILHPSLCISVKGDMHSFAEDTQSISSRTEQISTLANPDAIRLVLGISVQVCKTKSFVPLAQDAMDLLLELCSSERAGTSLGQLSECGLCQSLTDANGFAFIFDEIEHPLYSRFVALLRRISSFRMTYTDFVGMLRCISGPLLLPPAEQEDDLSKAARRIRLPLVQSSFGPDSTIDMLKYKGKEKSICARLETLSVIAERGDRVARCCVGGDSLNNIALLMQNIPMDEKLYWLAEQNRMSFIEIESIDATAKSTAKNNNSTSTGSGQQSTEKQWSAISTSGFSYSLWMRLPSSNEISGGNVFILDLSTPPGHTVSELGIEERRDFLSVWYDYQSQGFNVLASSSPKTVCFPISPLLPGVWHHILLTFQPPKRTVLSRKAVIGLCVDGRTLEADIKVDTVPLPPNSRMYIGSPNPFLASSGIIRGNMPVWELGSTLLLSTLLGPRDALSIFAAGPDFHGQFWGDRPQRLSLSATTTVTFSMLAEYGERESLLVALKRRGVSEVDNPTQISRDDILGGSNEQCLKSLASIGLFCNVSPEYIVCAFRASSSTNSMRDGSSSRKKSHYSRRLVNVAGINSNNHCVSTDAVVYGAGSIINPNSFADNIQWVGGPNVLLPIVNASHSPKALALALRLVRESTQRHIPNLEMMQGGGGYHMLGLLLRQKGMMSGSILEECFAFAVHGFVPGSAQEDNMEENKHDQMPYTWPSANQWVLVDLQAMQYLLLNHQVWDLQTSGPGLHILLMSLLNGLVSLKSRHAAFNSHRLHHLGVVKWTLHLMVEVAEIYALGAVGAELSECDEETNINQKEELLSVVQDAYKSGWHTETASVASTAVGSDPGNQLLLSCKTFLRRILAYMLTTDDLKSIARVAIYSLSIDVTQFDLRCQLILDKKNEESIEKEKLLVGATVRIYLLRLLEELVVDGVNEIVSADTVERRSSMGTSSLSMPHAHAGGASSFNQSYLSISIRRRKDAEDGNNTKLKQAQAFLSAIATIFTPVWFACTLEGCHDEASASAVFRLLILMHQSSPDFSKAFEQAGGFAPFVLSIPRFATSPSITLSMLSQLLHAPILHLPCFGNLDPDQLCAVFDSESDATELILNDSAQGGLSTPSDPSCGIFALLTECLGRNIQLGVIDDERGRRAIQTNTAVLALLRHRHTFSSEFQDFCRTPDFLEPLAQALCLLRISENFTQEKMTKHDDKENPIKEDLSVESQSVASEKLNKSTSSADLDENNDVYLSWPNEETSETIDGSDTGLNRRATRRPAVSTSKAETFTERFMGQDGDQESNGLGLVKLLRHVVSEAVLSRPHAAPLARALFRSFPIHATSERVEAFHVILIEQLASVIEDAMQRGSMISLANCIGISSVLLDRLMTGFLGSESTLETVKIVMSTLNYVLTPDTYAARTLAKEDPKNILIADAAHIARLTCLAALEHRMPIGKWTSVDESLHRDILTAVNKGLKQLLSTPFVDSKEMTCAIEVSPSSRFYRTWQSASLERCPSSTICKFPSISAIKNPDRTFITALMGALFEVLLKKEQKTREEAVLLLISLLQQRFEIMSGILIRDIPVDNEIVQKIDLLNNGGFGTLLTNSHTPSERRKSGDSVSTFDGGKFEMFFNWLEFNQSEIHEVFSGIHKEINLLIPGIYSRASSPEEAIEDEQKEMLVILASNEMSDKTIMGGFERTQLSQEARDKTSENQAMWKRQGFDYMSSGAMEWKFVLAQLKGSHSIWEGGVKPEVDQLFSFRSLVTNWERQRLDDKASDKKPIESEQCSLQTADISPPVELVTRWKLDVTEGHERQRRRLLPNYEFNTLYNVEEDMDTKDYNKSENNHDSDNSKAIETDSTGESQLPNPFDIGGDSMEATAALLKGMQLGTTQYEEDSDYDPNDDVDEIENDSYWDHADEEHDEDDTMNNSEFHDDEEISENTSLPSETNDNQEILQDEVMEDNEDSSPEEVVSPADESGLPSDLDSDSDVNDDVPQSSHRDDNLASNYDVIIGLLQAGDYPKESYNVKRCTGLEVCQALLIWCSNAIYIIDGFEQTDEDGLKGKINRLEKSTSTFEVNLRPQDFNAKDKSTQGNRNQTPVKSKGKTEQGPRGGKSYHQPRCKRLALQDVYAVYRRRYQLKQNSLEFYDTQRNGTLIAFGNTEQREEILTKVLSSPLPNSIFHINNASMGPNSTINYDKFMNSLRARITNQWIKGNMTNFDFIMHLNSFAGRTYNDLTQYPIFPWILSDYESGEIDLNNPFIYRDLSKPMGALGETRAVQFRERYEALQINHQNGDGPPAFHYGTHYSCAAYVLNYLLRLEPFSRLALSLQGGKFDIADRLFHNMSASWRSASRDNLQDVRELIPEFFYLPEFLSNNNMFDYGETQHGMTVHHVTLPPWAKGDPRRFIRINRQALESEYVSKNLHKWADLIFGYKQRGREAVNSLNMFVHVTYEGLVDIDTIEDPVQRESTIAQIQNFGQTPSRLERRPFPAKQIVKPLKDGTFDLNTIGNLEYFTPPFCVVGAPHIIHLKTTSKANYARVGMAGQADSAVGDMCLIKGQLIGVGKTCALIAPVKKYYRFGCSNNGVSVHVAVSTSRHKEINRVVTIHDDMHRAPITAVKPSRNGRWLVTGCMDSTVRVWKYDKGFMSLQATLCGHEGAKITCIDISTVFGTIVTGDSVGNVLVWDLRTLRYLRQLWHASAKKKVDLKVSSPEPVISVSLNHKTGDILTLVGSTLTIFDINGSLVAKQSSEDVISFSSGKNTVPSCAISTDCTEWMDKGIIAVTGHKNGDIRFWGVNRDEELLIMRHLLMDKLHSCPITCLRIEGKRQDQLLAGDKSGKMSISQTIRLGWLAQNDLTRIAEEIMNKMY